MRDAIQLLTQLVAAQAQRQELGTGHAYRSVSARVLGFINLDPLVFTGADQNEDPQVFIDRMQRTLRVMKAIATESVELASYRLQDVAVNWYESWELSRGDDSSPAVWQEFTEAFLRHYLPPELRRARVDRFLTLRQGNMSVREYSFQFDSLARYAPTIPDMDIYRIQAYAQGEEKHKQKQRDTATSSLVIEVKERQYEDPMLVHYRDTTPQKEKTPFEITEDGVLRYGGRLCVPNIAGLRRQVMGETHYSH
ncbi:uncharacterized protein [Nicotiana tomentosiformis]|uniref:uncharacterized protein n=1 Tax=Nicotiana tomentosiformis TaxID=4098 RepID=UPI00388CD149